MQQESTLNQGGRASGAFRLGNDLVAVLGEIVTELETLFPSLPAVEEAKSALAVVRKRLAQPFRLAVAGQFRAGKSSLVNAVVGAEVALVDEVEATSLPTRYYFAETPCAAVVHRDGARKELSIADCLETASRRRTDAAWLESVERLEFGCPNTALSRVELWDTPGLGGSAFTHRTAEDFAGQVDAAVWVFDADALGKADITPAMERISARGKLVLGVLNKAECLDAADAERASATLRRLYERVEFAGIVPFSARAALGVHGLGPAVTIYGDALDPDGNLSRLLARLEELVLRDPGRLGVQAASGDAAAVLRSLEDRLTGASLNWETALDQFDRALAASTEAAGERYERIEERLAAGWRDAVRLGMLEELRRDIEGASMEELKSETWFTGLLGRYLSPEALVPRLQAYFEREREALQAVAEGLGLDVREALQASLSAPERLALRGGGEDLSPSGSPGEALILSVDQQFGRAAVVATGTGFSLGGLALLVPGPQWPFVAVGAAAAFVFSLFRGNQGVLRGVSAERTMRKLAEKRWELAVEVADKWLEELAPTVAEEIRQSAGECRRQALEALARNLAETLLQGRSPAEARSLLGLLGPARERAGELCRKVVPFTARQLPPKANPLHRPCRVEADNRLGREDLWAALVAAAAGEITIVDENLSQRDLSRLLEFDRALPLRFVAAAEPLSPATVDGFSEAVDRLRTARAGSVTVLVPEGREEGAAAEWPEGCVIATGGTAYRFSVGLAGLLAGPDAFDFTPVRDPGEIDRLVGRWWDRAVPGFRFVAM